MQAILVFIVRIWRKIIKTINDESEWKGFCACKWRSFSTLFYPEIYPILLGLFYGEYKQKTTESTIENWWNVRLELEMKVVQLLQKAWPEFIVLFSSITYLMIRIVADVNKINLPTWFEYFDIPKISSFLMTFILLYRNIISE